MTTKEQDEKFRNFIVSSTLLDNVIIWIQNNMTPEEVFSTKVLTFWAKDNVYIKEKHGET